MKKFTLRGVLDGFRSTVGSSSSSGSTSKADAVGAEETIWSEHFQAAKVGVATRLVVVYNNLLVTLVTQKIVVDRPL